MNCFTITRLTIAIVAVYACSAVHSQAQLERGSFGIGASFAFNQVPFAQMHFATSEKFQLDLGFGIQNSDTEFGDTTASIDASTTSFTVAGGAKIFFGSEDVVPFIGIGVSYSSIPTFEISDPNNDDNLLSAEANAIGVSLGFGGQGYIAKNIALNATIVVAYVSTTADFTILDSKVEQTLTAISFGGSSVGASFYF